MANGKPAKGESANDDRGRMEYALRTTHHAPRPHTAPKICVTTVAQRPVLHTVVVNLWRNQAADPDGGRVHVTNTPITDPWPVVDGYDDRSWIENGLFRTSKQFWQLTRWFPQKTEASVQSHLTFGVMLLAVATA